MVKSDNPNPNSNQLSPNKKSPDNRAHQPGQSSANVGNEEGQKAATQTGSKGSHDQAGKYGQRASDRRVGATPPQATPAAPNEERDEEVEKR